MRVNFTCTMGPYLVAEWFRALISSPLLSDTEVQFEAEIHWHEPEPGTVHWTFPPSQTRKLTCKENVWTYEERYTFPDRYELISKSIENGYSVSHGDDIIFHVSIGTVLS